MNDWECSAGHEQRDDTCIPCWREVEKRAECQHQVLVGAIGGWRRVVDEAEGAIARLREALRDFGVHRTDCRSRGLITGQDRSCTCGLAAAKGGGGAGPWEAQQ